MNKEWIELINDYNEATEAMKNKIDIRALSECDLDRYCCALMYAMDRDEFDWINGMNDFYDAIQNEYESRLSPKSLLLDDETCIDCLGISYGFCPGRCGYVYVLEAASGWYKIGRTVNPRNRYATFKIQLPFPVTYEIVIYSCDYVALEMKLHDQFDSLRGDGEWFRLTNNEIDLIRNAYKSAITDIRWTR